MKIVHKGFLVALLTALPALSFSQDGPSPKKERKAAMLEHLQKELDLTAEQANKIKAIESSFSQEREALHKKMEALHQEIKAMRDKQKQEIDKVLSAEQKAKLEQLRAERMEKRKARRSIMKEKMRDRRP